MMRLSFQSRSALALLLVACLASAITLAWLCLKSPSIAFLPAAAGAEWILYPKPAEGARQRALPLSAVFRRAFIVTDPSAKAGLSYRAFKRAGIAINDQVVPTSALGEESNWKMAKTIEVSRWLHAGTNLLTLSVTNSVGPPALWLRLDTPPTLHSRPSSLLATDESWEVSLAGAAWQNARLATRPPKTGQSNPLYGGERTLDSLKRIWPTLAILFAASLLLLLLIESPFARGRLNQAKAGLALLILVLVTRAALFVHNSSLLPRSRGFDAEAHEEYVQFIQQHRALPLPKDGWEMFQPPLYYLTGAALLATSGHTTADDTATLLLRAINGFVGLVHCWVIWLCLRLLFPDNFQAQAAGLLLAAFLPPHLYLSQYVTNEPLAGLFVTAAFYLLLRALKKDEHTPTRGLKNRWLDIGIGVALGAALLSKFSSLLAIAPIIGRLFFRTLSEPKSLLRYAPWARLGIVLLSCLAVCGWHYGRVWAQSGRPIVGNWEPGSAFAWWQDPGFHTGSFFLSFGQSLVSPLFSSFYSFADGLYSTLWGDGLTGGAARLAARPSWNYDWMNAGYLLGVVISVLFLVGFALAVVRFIRRPSPQWLAILGTTGLFGVGILYMCLRVPSYAQVKSFYAFPALLPFTAITVVGCSWLAAKHRGLRIGVYTVLLVWTFTTCSAFWVRPQNPEVALGRGIYLAGHQREAEAVASLSLALQLDENARHSREKPLLQPGKAEAHFHLAMVLDRQGHTREAIDHYRAALAAENNFDGALNNLAWIRAANPNDALRNGPEAVRFSERACELTHDLMTTYIGTLAAAYAEAGRFDEAIATAQKAVSCARLRNENELAQTNEQLLQLYLARKPYRESTTDAHR